MSDKDENVVNQDDSASRNGEENFKEEIKDYAKTTMNELLGMFGYDDEITSESVESLDIKVPSTSDEPKVTSAATASQVAMVTAQMPSTPVTMTTVSMATTPVVIPVSEDSSNDTPIIVKVEGNTSVSDIIRQQNIVAASSKVSSPVSKTPDIPATDPTPVIQSAAPAKSTVTTTSQSTTVQPALVKPPITTQSSPASSSTKTTQSSTSSVPVVKIVSQYLQYSIQLNQQVRPCTWCKKVFQLKNFTFREGNRVLECRGICSEACFENAALSIDVNNDNIKSIQDRIRQLRQAKKIKSIPVVKPLFDWERYLKNTGAKGAPWSCFKQSSSPPHNGFKPGMKLEVSDPRIIKSTCLATIVGSIGPRIRCRFDGTDKSNDVWHMVDSTEIHPVGWCEANDGTLQPPVGFRHDPGRYQTFLAKTLASDSPDSIIAPARIFKKEPESPASNMFTPGMKLEALDPKNQSLICVASVGKVEGEKLRIDFDGYLGSDYWCRFDSRNIFPVGWCALSGHPLQPPGSSKKSLKQQSANRAKQLKEPEEPTQKSSKPQIKLPVSSSTSSSSSSTSSSSSSSSSSSKQNPPSPAQDSSTTSTSSSDLEVPVSHLNRLSIPTVCVFVNHGCKVGKHLDPDVVARTLPTHWRGRIADVLKPCLQGIVDCAYDQPTVFGFLKPGHGKTSIVAHGNGKTLSCVLQNIDRVRIFWKVLERFVEDLQCCDNFVSSSQIKGQCKKCYGKSEPKTRLKRHSTETSDALPNKVLKTNTKDESSPQVCSTSPAKTWTVDEVIKYMENTELADHISLFKVHEIDGRALLLLNRDMIMSYMGLKLGPAIKLLNIVQDLKPKQICEV